MGYAQLVIGPAGSGKVESLSLSLSIYIYIYNSIKTMHMFLVFLVNMLY
jgi:hypothetical protein